jgi:hypothetical protein
MSALLYIASDVGSYRGCRQVSPLMSAIYIAYCLLPLLVLAIYVAADVGY